MRKRDKQKALDFVKTLNIAHEEALKAISRDNTNLAQTLLEQCLEGARALEDMIRNKNGPELPASSHIKSYEGMVRRARRELGYGVQLADVGAAWLQEADEAVKSCLRAIGESIKHDVPVRLEAVFLPYKASMWDSLESVWQAADADGNCDAYVIPIPYYDKNQDGSFREVHYEGDGYPDYVPITHFSQYDFPDRHPDVIFIHNPYDACNYVTSVHPFFYSANLKQYTDLLVYIPYFILKEPNSQAKEANGYIEGFCTVPGVVNADKVIVQSENMRQVCINILTGLTGDNKQSRKYWEQKILGLGSPKVDRILETKEEDLDIPEEWMKIIRRPDGSRKKIVFYNTGITGLLQNNEHMLRKIEDVLETFRRYKEEAALLWRPHPLMESTIISMQPELWEKYRAIRDKYISEGWGIYDGSTDLDRAVALCDAYYGDGSSVVELCEIVGKPVMLQDVNVLGGRKGDAG